MGRSSPVQEERQAGFSRLSREIINSDCHKPTSARDEIKVRCQPLCCGLPRCACWCDMAGWSGARIGAASVVSRGRRGCGRCCCGRRGCGGATRTGRRDRVGALRPRGRYPRRHGGTGRPVGRQDLEPSSARRFPRCDEPVTRRPTQRHPLGAGARGQPVHAVWRHQQGSASELDRRRSTRAG